MSVRVAVTGSSGLIGSALAARLEASGHEVTRVVRRAVTPGEKAVRWDPGAGTIDSRGLNGLDAVVNLAGAGVGDHRWTKARKRVVLESRTQGTALLAGVLAKLQRPPGVLVERVGHRFLRRPGRRDGNRARRAGVGLPGRGVPAVGGGGVTRS